MNKLASLIALLTCSTIAVPACAQELKQKNVTKQSTSASLQSVKKISVEIPITNQIYVQARLNNSEPMWFMLDTGATWSILDVDKAKELNIKSEGGRTLDLGQTYTVTTTFAKDASLDISGVKVPVKVLAVMPAKFRHAPQIVGLIGSDLCKRFVVKIDYTTKTLELFEPKNYTYAGRGEILPIEIIEEIPHVTVHISKGNVSSLKTNLLVDTGAAQTVMLYAPFVEKNKLLESTEGTIKLRAGGLGGGDFNYKVRAKAVNIGNFRFDDPLINFSTGRGAADRRDGVLGNGFLDRFNVIIDYSRKQVILEPTQRLNVPTDFDFFTFKITQSGNAYIIADLLQNSTAGQAGLKSGDVLLSVDGNPVSDLALIQIQRMFMMDGRDRVLTIKRAGETLEIKLKTVRIF